jgi:hypothetical protein
MANVLKGNKAVLTLFALLFGVAFTLGGILGGILPLYQQGKNWWAARSYVPLAAQVEAVDLAERRGSKGSTSYLVKASFSYEYQGRHYTAQRATFSDNADNIGDFHQRVHQQLLDAQQLQLPVQLWVDPMRPEDSVYDRTIRWQMLLFHLPFAFLFTGVGLGAWYALYYLWFAPARKTQAKRTQAGQTLRIGANSSGVWFLLLFALFWNLLAWPICLLAFGQSVPGARLGAIVSAVFPAVGVLLAWITWNTWRKSRFAGKPELEISGMAPLRGRIHFHPALGLGAAQSQPMHPVAVDAKMVRDVGNSRSAKTETLWEQRLVKKSLPRGTEVVDFSVDLKPLSEDARHQILLQVADTTYVFELPG